MRDAATVERANVFRQRTVGRRTSTSAVIYLALTVCAVLFIFPLYWLAVSSFKPILEMFMVPPTWWPRAGSLANYADAFVTRGFVRFMANSGIIAGASTLVAMALGILAAYGLARHPFVASRTILLAVLSLRMVPGIALIVPLFVVMSRLNLVDTRLGLILAYIPLQIPLVIWLMHSFFSEVPVELDDAARIDGCSRLQAFLHVALPMSLQGVLVTAILVFVWAWNEFPLALILTTEAAKTMPVALAGLVAGWEIIWGALFAGSVAYMIPLLLIVSIMQKHIARGFLGGALKQ